jgi:hypothetical protein
MKLPRRNQNCHFQKSRALFRAKPTQVPGTFPLKKDKLRSEFTGTDVGKTVPVVHILKLSGTNFAAR